MPKDTPESSAIAAIERQVGAVEVLDIEPTDVMPDWREWMAPIPRSEGAGDAVHTATTVDDVLADLPEAKGLRDFIGRPITIYGARLAEGDIDGRHTFYVVLDVEDGSTGDRVAVTTGANYVMHQIAQLCKIGSWPIECKPYEVGLGRRGMSDPIHLGKVDRVDF